MTELTRSKEQEEMLEEWRQRVTGKVGSQPVVSGDSDMERKDVLISDLKVSDLYQRPQRKSFVKQIVKNYNSDAFLEVVVGRRSDGSMWVIDGGHRLAAAVLMGWTTVRAHVRSSIGSEYEAYLHGILNTKVKQTEHQLFKSRFEAGDPETLGICAVVNKAGFAIDMNDGYHRWPFLRAIKAIRLAYRKDCLKEVLDVIGVAWPGDSQAIRIEYIKGLTSLFKIHGDRVDIERLKNVLGKVSPANLEAKAFAFKMTGRRSVPMRMAIEVEYDRRLGPDRRLGSSES